VFSSSQYHVEGVHVYEYVHNTVVAGILTEYLIYFVNTSALNLTGYIALLYTRSRAVNYNV